MNRMMIALALSVRRAPVLVSTTLNSTTLNPTKSLALRMGSLRRSISPTFCIVFVVLLWTSTLANAGSKVEVCHLPPDNLDNWHTIKIPENALEEHLDHGDLIGSCGSLAENLCDDGNACTRDEFTQDESVCKAVEERTPVDCNDNDPETADSCNPSTGCENTKTTTCNVAGSSCRIFRTITVWPYDSLGGLAGADAKCQASADAASLGGTFRAWLSTSTTSAADRLVHAAVPYTRVDDTRIASDWGDLTDGNLDASILTTESGLPVPIVFPANGRAWTGTSTAGLTQTNCIGGCTCNDWQSSSIDVYSNPGSPNFTDGAWTGYDGANVWCQKFTASGGLGLYCVEQ